MKHVLPRAWYREAEWLRWLRPLSRLFHRISSARREAWRSGRKPVYHASVPVIVIGNLTAGGTGKTPLTLALCHYLQEQGLKPAIVSRGYGGRSKRYPLLVTMETSPAECGDEALLLALNTDAPVMVDPDRSRGVRMLEAQFQPDVILCDDGLQHYALGRDIEIAVVDGERGFGNGKLLPEGPLREEIGRLLEVDYVVVNGDTGLELPEGIRARAGMELVAERLVNIHSGAEFAPEDWLAQHAPIHDRVHAIAGIGNPERFFNTLCAMGFVIIAHPFPDHHRFRREEIAFADSRPVIMTEKDAVKCLPFASERHWCLKVQALLHEDFLAAIAAQVAEVQALKRTEAAQAPLPNSTRS